MQKSIGGEYNLRHDQDQTTTSLFFDHSHSDRIVDSLRPAGKITGVECAHRVPAWSLGIGCGGFLHRRRFCRIVRPASSERHFPRLVRSARPHGHRLLADLSSAFTHCHASQLERLVSSRAAVPHCHHLCRHGRFASNWIMAIQYLMVNVIGEHSLHHRLARGLRDSSKCNAPASLPHL